MTFIRAATVGVNAPMPKLAFADAKASSLAKALAEIDAEADAAAEALAFAVAAALALSAAHTWGANLATTLSGPSWSLTRAARIAIGKFRKLDAMVDSRFTHTQLIVFVMPLSEKSLDVALQPLQSLLCGALPAY
jgi:hypothetical protein